MSEPKPVYKAKRFTASSAEYQMIKALLVGDTRKGWRMNDGLAMALTPAKVNNGVNRLAFSRKGTAVSDDEGAALGRLLVMVLGRRGVGEHPAHPIRPKREGDMVAFEWRVRMIEL